MAKNPSKRKRVEPHKPRIRWAYVPAIIAFITIPLDLFVFGPLDPGFNPQLNAAAVFFVVSFCFLMLSLGWFGLEAGIHANSPQIFTPIGTWSMGDIAPIPVDSVPYGIDPYTNNAIPDAERVTGKATEPVSPRGRTILDQMVDGKLPGQETTLAMSGSQVIEGSGRKVLIVLDANGKRVNKAILPLGGIKAFTLWFRPGSAGFIILRGEDELLRMGAIDRGEFAFIGKIPEEIDHNCLSEGEVKTLRRFSAFTPESPVYVLKSWAGPYIDFVQATADAHRQMISGSELTHVSGSLDSVAVLNENLQLRSVINWQATRIRSLEESVRSGDQTLLGQRQRSAELHGGHFGGPGDAPVHQNVDGTTRRAIDQDQ